MDQSKSWRRGFAGGFLTLGLAVAGQVTTGGGARACSIATQPSVAEQVLEHLRPAIRDHGGVAQRVALAVLGAVVHTTCS